MSIIAWVCRPGDGPGCSAAGQHVVAQRLHFELGLVQPVFDDVADADDAAKPSVLPIAAS